MADTPRKIHLTEQLEWLSPLFPQDCGMHIHSGELLQGRANFDSMLDLFL